MATTSMNTDRDANPDAITGEPGSHPIGAGVGAAVGGAAAGAAAGAIAGPIGTVAGAVAGGVAGGLAGKEIAEQIDPSEQEHYWRNMYTSREYYDSQVGYHQIGPAYQYGWESRVEYGDRHWDEVEPDLAHEWPDRRGQSTLDWGRARPATRDAWDRVDTAFRKSPGEAAQTDSTPSCDVPRMPK